MSNAPKKVVPAVKNAKNTEPSAEKAEKVKKVRPEFVIPSDCLNEEGKMVRVPETFNATHVGKFRPWRKDEFADRATNLDYRAILMEARAARMVEGAKRLRDEAAAERTGGGAKAKKIAKLRAALAALEAELAAGGISV